ncbi:B3 domain-containing protein Os07g0563300-like [Bidens hawaiensis]|uniref:B3 domain-containing protein Os07g0563300-like n=1 Tax=Bidens hawaiensis TaxID=980011 RepID=UPI00404B5C13
MASVWCLNSYCNQPLTVPRQGWLCRTGDFADLCDRCSSAFEDGKFCDTYHMNASGWRCCESCGKQIHCGCIVSFHTYILLDAGGIECLKCAKTEYILTPNTTWPSGRINDISSKSWRSIAGPCPIPWRQAPSLFNAAKDQPELQLTSCSLGQSTRNRNDSWRAVGQETTMDKAPTGMFKDGKHNLFKDVSYQSYFHTNDSYDQKIESINASGVHVKRLCTPSSVGNQSNNNGLGPSLGNQAHHTKAQYVTRSCHQPLLCYRSQLTYQDGLGSSLGNQAQDEMYSCYQLFSRYWSQSTEQDGLGPSLGNQAHHNKAQDETYSCHQLLSRCRSQSTDQDGFAPSLGNQAHHTKAQDETHLCHKLLSRYWSQLTDQELQQLPAGSNTKITPLFEKMLSASDAGKGGRLVLPKKYAEAYLPPITEPDGYPLVIQDIKGKEWVLQYRFWSNSSSRMYVLEGVTPCIQSMHLQAGDTVTFSRLEPEGKLVMGFRKASLASPSYKGSKTTNTRIEESLKNGTWSEVDKLSSRAKRKKGVNMRSNSKSLRFSVTLEQVQGLLQPPLNAPTVVLIEGVEFEVFQDTPFIGSPRAFSTDSVGSPCSTVAEPTPKHLDHTLPMINHENTESVNTMESLDAFADLAVHDSKTTRGHPCILQPPPNGSNHKSTCRRNMTPPPTVNHDLTHPTQLLYAGQSFEQSFKSTIKSQNIDLNIQPRREEDSDSMGIMRLVQESTQRYMKQQQQKLSIKNHDL